MRGELHDASVAERAVSAEGFDLAFCGLRAEVDIPFRCPDLAGDGAQFVGRFGQRRLLAQDGDIAKPTPKEAYAPLSNGKARNLDRAGLRFLGGHACFAKARLSLFADPRSSGLPNPINGIVAVLGLASRRSAFKEDTEGSTVMLCSRMSQDAFA